MDTTLGCAYSDGTTCECTPCCDSPGCTFFCNGAPSSSIWSCAPPPVVKAPCPSSLPNDGAPCTLPEGTTCLAATCGLNVTCEGARWRWRTETTSCPSSTGVCASPDTPIATPDGDRRIDAIRAGDFVYSVNGEAIVPVPVLRATRTLVWGHRVLRVRLTDGARLEISPAHPTADGALFADLLAGGMLDGRRIESIESIPYEYPATYDILPASDTGTYFAAGARIGSTLRESTHGGRYAPEARPAMKSSHACTE